VQVKSRYSYFHNFIYSAQLAGTYCLVIALSACSAKLSGSVIPTSSSTPTTTATLFLVGNLTPSHGSIAGGTLLTINGTSFTSTSTITVGGTDCPVSGTPTSTQIICTTAAHALGQVSVVVSNPTTTLSTTFANSFTYSADAPVLNAAPIAPVSGTTLGSTPVVISGTGFLSGATATVGGQTCTSGVLNTGVSPNTYTCNTAAHAGGAVAIVLTNPDGQISAASSAYTYIAPAIAPAGLTYSTNPAWYASNVTITSNSPTCGGGAVLSYAVAPALPTGLTLNTTSGIISGTPTMAVASATYVVTAANATGSTTVNLILGVSDFGNGSSGAFSATSSSQVINNYTYVTDATVASGATGMNVYDPSNFYSGDRVLILQTQGAVANSMFWEFGTVAYTPPAGTTYVALNAGLTNAYTSGTYNTTSALVTQMIRVPQYTNATIPAGIVLTSPAWEAITGNHYGGVIAFNVSGTLTVNGSINAAALGFRGGTGVVNAAGANSQAGESWIGKGNTSTAQNNGGGGGSTSAAATSQSGAGGSYATAGGGGSSSYAGTSGSAGGTFGIADLTHIFMGPGGGGSTDARGCGTTAPTGSSGGGLILIYANNLILGAAGSISANGAAATADSTCAGDVGGAGSGGSIYVKSSQMTIGVNLITAIGGTATTFTVGPNTGTGGAGGNGRIRLDYNTISGSSNPAVGFTAAP
jgi:hypothetical protein